MLEHSGYKCLNSAQRVRVTLTFIMDSYDDYRDQYSNTHTRDIVVGALLASLTILYDPNTALDLENELISARLSLSKRSAIPFVIDMKKQYAVFDIKRAELTDLNETAESRLAIQGLQSFLRDQGVYVFCHEDIPRDQRRLSYFNRD